MTFTDPFTQNMPRAIFDAKHGELLAIVGIDIPFDMFSTMEFVGAEVKTRWYWRYITPVEFETYQVFGIKELKRNGNN